MKRNPPRFIDESAARRRFNRLAATYDAHAEIERDVGDRLLDRLSPIRLSPKRIVDLGCGPGGNAAGLRRRFPEAWYCEVDFASAMLMAGHRGNWLNRLFPGSRRRVPLCANANELPLAAGSIDLVWSNLLLPWVDDPLRTFSEIHRVLRPEGLVSFSTLGPDSLKEIRRLFGDRHTRIHRFADMHDIGDMLIDAGYADPVVDMELVRVSYQDPMKVFSDLRSAGGNFMVDRPRGMMGRSGWAALCEALRTGAVASGVTLELIFGHAWKRDARPRSREVQSIKVYPRGKRNGMP